MAKPGNLWSERSCLIIYHICAYKKFFFVLSSYFSNVIVLWGYTNMLFIQFWSSLVWYCDVNYFSCCLLGTVVKLESAGFVTRHIVVLLLHALESNTQTQHRTVVFSAKREQSHSGSYGSWFQITMGKGSS